MAQGKAWNKEEVFEVLEPVFKLGCSIRKACEYTGMPHSTVATWLDKDPILRTKVKSWQNEPNMLARKNWLKKMQKDNEKGDYNASKEWLERKEKDEFSPRQESTGADGTPLNIQVTNYQDKNSNKKEDEKT